MLKIRQSYVKGARLHTVLLGLMLWPACAQGGAGRGDDGQGAAGGSTSGAAGEGEGGTTVEPYAHVVAVATSGSERAFTFDVSVESSDVDCGQFANWWEVLSGEGQLLYRRILLHSHTDANGTSDPDAPGNTFTRSGGPVEIDESDVVLVRAHLSTVGYNGSVMRGSVAGGFFDAPDVPRHFAVDLEGEPPQPAGCQF